MKPVLTTAVEVTALVNGALRALIASRKSTTVERCLVHNRASACGPTRVRVETVVFSDGQAAQAWGMSENLTIGKWLADREVIVDDDTSVGLDLAGSIVELIEKVSGGED